MQQDDNNFTKIFWFICFLVFTVIAVDVMVMFIPIPAGGQKYADILMGGLNTGALMAGIQYLLGGNPLAKKSTNVSGDNATVNNNVPPPVDPVNPAA